MTAASLVKIQSISWLLDNESCSTHLCVCYLSCQKQYIKWKYLNYKLKMWLVLIKIMCEKFSQVSNNARLWIIQKYWCRLCLAFKIAITNQTKNNLLCARSWRITVHVFPSSLFWSISCASVTNFNKPLIWFG